MKPTERIVLLQKQVKIARKALEEIKNRSGHESWCIADEALDEIERVRFVQEGRYD